MYPNAYMVLHGVSLAMRDMVAMGVVTVEIEASAFCSIHRIALVLVLGRAKATCIRRGKHAPVQREIII